RPEGRRRASKPRSVPKRLISPPTQSPCPPHAVRRSRRFADHSLEARAATSPCRDRIGRIPQDGLLVIIWATHSPVPLCQRILDQSPSCPHVQFEFGIEQLVGEDRASTGCPDAAGPRQPRNRLAA